MERYQVAVEKFIADKGYLDNPRVLGIVVCGSYTTGYEHKGSDIDVHVIMKTGFLERITRFFKIIRGARTLEIEPKTYEAEEYKIEYFEKPISDLYASARRDYKRHSNALVPIIAKSNVVYSRGNQLRRLREYITKKYSKPLPPLDGNDAGEEIVIDYNKVEELRYMLANNRPEFDYYYYYVVRKLKEAYSKMCGCADVPEDKVIRIYTDPNYREAFCKSTVPDQEFVDMFISAITAKMTNEEKVAMVEKMWEHMNKKYLIDPKNYEMLVRSRNDWRSPHNK